MAKYSQPSEEIEKIVKEIANELSLNVVGIDFQPLCASNMKEVCKIVKANELAEYASDREGLIFILCNETAFEGADTEGHPYADEKTKYMWIRNEMEKVSYDYEKDKIIMNGPTLSVPVCFYEKEKELAINSYLLGFHVLAQIEEKRKEEAERKKAEKAEKKNKRK